MEFDIQSVHPSLRHPHDPTLFKVSEGDYVTADYITRRCARVECTFDLWHGTERNGGYVPAAPVVYEGLSRADAFNAIVYALNTHDPAVNPQARKYSNIHTREVIEPTAER